MHVSLFGAVAQVETTFEGAISSNVFDAPDNVCCL